jgi:chromosome segregation ATPase
MERTVSKVDRERTESEAELATISGRLEEAIEENSQLRSRLRNLEGNLQNVTREAKMLVNGLRDNERRWEQAESKYLRTEEELKRSTAALEEEVSRSFELGKALEVERNQADALRAANQELTKQLAEGKLLAPTVDLRDQNWSTRRWRRARARQLFSHSHGKLPD